jgi:hypothetical protein
MKIINVLITIDTNAVKAAYPKQSNPSSSKPVGIGHQYGFMVATNTTVNSGQGTGDLSFQALVGDQVMVFGVSGSDQFDDAVLVYGMPKYGGTEVFGTFISQMYTKSTVAPGTGTSVLPPQTVTENFWFYQANVATAGTENFQVQFGLWSRDPNTGAPVLYGYFQWDPTITVAG